MKGMQRRTVIMSAVVGVAIVALWWVFVFSPKNKQLSSAHSDLASAQHEGDTLHAQLAELRDIASRNTEIQAQLGKLSAAIPATPDQGNFITGLNGIADASGISWQSVTMQQPTTANPGEPPSIPVQILIQGGFFQAVDYLNRLEALDRLVVVDSVNMTSGSGNGGTKSGSGTSPASGITGPDSSTDLTVTLNARIFSQGTEGATAGTTSGATGAGGNGGTGNNGVTG